MRSRDGSKRPGSQTRFEVDCVVRLGPQTIFLGTSQGSSNRNGRVLERLKNRDGGWG